MQTPTKATTGEPRRDRYDVVVIGAGMAGLTAGALLARTGRSVLVVEERDRPGGHCRSLVSGAYEFNPAVHVIMGLGPVGESTGAVTAILDLLGVADDCAFVRSSPWYDARFPDMTVRVDDSVEAFVTAHAERFPGEQEGLRTLTDLGQRLLEQFVRFPIQPGIRDLATASVRFPDLVRYQKSTVAEMTARHLSDPRLRAAYMALYPYVMLPPRQAPFADWAMMLANFLGEGAFYPRGGFQRLADAVSSGLTRHGGELVTQCRVARVLADGGRVTGVVLNGGQQIRCDRVVATGDPRPVLESLAGSVRMPRRYLRRLDHTALSSAILTMYLATDLDVAEMDIAPETMLHPTWDLDASFHAALGGEATSVMVTVPTLIDPSTAPAGTHQVVIAGAAPHEATRANPQRLSAAYLRSAEQVIPGLSNHLIHVVGPDGEPVETRTPPLHVIRTPYGWASAVGQTGTARLPRETPVPGLTLCGQWTQPGGGVWTVMLSAVMAVREFLETDTDRGVLPLGL